MSKSISERCAGAQRINNPAAGNGDTLKFVNVPDSLSGAFLEELCGLDSKHNHPLKGAVYYTENTGPDTFDITVFQNDLEELAKSFAGWFMGHTFMEYADNDTMNKISLAKQPS